MAHDHVHSSLGQTPHDHGVWTRGHVFLGQGHARAESRAKLAALVTAVFMVVEIGAGFLYRSMALLADGVHMATHVGALGLAAGAYWLARRHAGNARFSFGSGKFGDLAAFSSAIVLGLTALAVAGEAIERLLHPAQVAYGDALLIACIGLGVNLVSAFILKDDHHHDHGHDHAHADHHHGSDNNMRAAYVHVLADAITSVLAIVGLLAGRFYGLVWMDSAMALIGVGVILSWSVGLMGTAGTMLLDMVPDRGLAGTIRQRLEIDGDKVCDLHLWRLGPGHAGLIASVVADRPQAPSAYKERLEGIAGLSHVTVEVHACEEHKRAA
jgi:cation diffusion facilitator family transporter